MKKRPIRCSVNCSGGTHASGKAPNKATHIPNRITWRDFASFPFPERRARRMMPNSGQNAHQYAVQNSIQYGHTNGKGLMVSLEGSLTSGSPASVTDAIAWRKRLIRHSLSIFSNWFRYHSQYTVICQKTGINAHPSGY